MFARTQELVGRARELALIDELLDQARAGEGRTVLFAGEPGLGKTSLLEAARRRASDFTVLSCCGMEWEAQLPWAALHELLRPLEAQLEALPAPQRHQLGVAFGREEGEATPGLHLFAAVLGLVLDAARDAPVLLILDDLQWVDAVSLRAFAFLARRIQHDAVAVLGATRPVDAPFVGLPDPVAVSPLDRAAVGALAEQRVGQALPDATLDELAVASAGNPLAVVESAAHAGDRLWLRGSGLQEPLPVGALIERGFSDRIHGLSAAAMSAAELVAVTVADHDGLIRAAVGARGLDGAALTEAQDHRVLALDQGRWRFTHPLLRSIVDRRTAAPDRRRAHAAIAEVTRDPQLAAWHAAAAAEAPDAGLADALIGAAERLEARGGALAAAVAFERAAELTPDPEVAAGRFIEAARAARSAGLPVERVLALSERALDLATEERTRVRAEHQSLFAQAMTADSTDLHADMVRLADRALTLDPGVAVDLLRMMLNDAVLIGDRESFVAARARLASARQSVALSRWEEVAIDSTLQCYGVLYGEADADGMRRVGAEVEQILRAEEPLLRHLGGSASLAVDGLMWLEEFERAQSVAEALVGLAIEQGDAVGELISCFVACELGVRVGDLGAVVANADRGMELAQLTGVASLGASCEAFGQYVQAVRTGNVDEPVLARVDAMAREVNVLLALEFSYVARAAAALAGGRYQEAVGHFEAVERWKRPSGHVEPCIGTWPVDVVQALILAGDEERARARLEELRDYAERTGRRWALAAAHWLAAVLEPSDEAAFAGFAEALRIYPGARAPFEEARARLAFGERLRRVGRRADARVQLEAALDGFVALAAEPWAERARHELAASGKGVRRAAPHERDELTLQERRVAELVVAGASNKQVAAELFLSPKTIESHLGRIYRKLDVTSRTQLAARWSELGTGE